MEVGEHLYEFAEEQRHRVGWHVAKVDQGQDELLGELLAGQCDVVQVDRDGRPHQLVQGVPLVVSAYEVVKCRKRIALPESLKDCGDLPTRFQVGDIGGHEVQADCHDGLWIRQQRESLRIVHADTNEELEMIAESMNLLWGQTYGYRVAELEATVVSASLEGLTTVTDALFAKARKPSPGLEGVNDLTSDPRVAAGVSTET